MATAPTHTQHLCRPPICAAVLQTAETEDGARLFGGRGGYVGTHAAYRVPRVSVSSTPTKLLCVNSQFPRLHIFIINYQNNFFKGDKINEGPCTLNGELARSSSFSLSSWAAAATSSRLCKDGRADEEEEDGAAAWYVRARAAAAQSSIENERAKTTKTTTAKIAINNTTSRNAAAYVRIRGRAGRGGDGCERGSERSERRKKVRPSL